MITAKISNVVCPTGADKKTKGKLAQQFNNNPPKLTQLPLDEFIDQVGTKGYAWSAGLSNGPNTNEACSGIQVLALDIDDGMNQDEFLTDCSGLGFVPTAIYPSPNNSGTPATRYRALWCLDQPVTMDNSQYRAMVNPYIKHFGADKSCKNIARLWFGGSHVSHVDYSKIYSYDDITSVGIKLTPADRSARLYIEKLAILGETLSNTLRESPELATFDEFVIDDKKETHELFQYPSGGLYEDCMLLDDIYNGKEHSGDHLAKVSLASQLKHFRGSKQHVQAAYTKNRPDWKKQLPWIWKHSKATSCHRTCPYYNECISAPSLLQRYTFNWKRVSTPNYVERDTMIKALEDEMREALCATDGKIHTIRAQVGAGKTSRLAELLKELQDEEITVACENHARKLEFSQLLDALGVEHKVTPEIPDCLTKEERDQVDRAYSIGAFKEGNEILSQYAEGREFIHERRKPIAGLTVTTHDKMLVKGSSNRVTVFDEDIFKKIRTIDTAKVYDIANFCNFLKAQGEHRLSLAYEQFIEGSNQCFINNTRRYEFDARKLYKLHKAFLEENKCNSNLLTLANSSLFTRRYNDIDGKQTDELLFLNKIDMPKGTVVILSATASQTIYEQMFGSRLQWHELPVAQETQSPHDTTYSYSKSSLVYQGKHKCILDMLEESDNYVVTSKGLSSKLNKDNELDNPIHFGNCTGSNELSQQDFVILSKHLLPPTVIALYAKSIDFDWLPMMGYSRERCDVTINGFRGKIETFPNQTMREIDLWLADSELEQARGRGRLLWNDNTVPIFGDLPTRFSKLVKTREAVRTCQSLKPPMRYSF